MVSLHKINKLVCFAAPLNTRQAYVRASPNLSTALLTGQIFTLSPPAVCTVSDDEEFTEQPSSVRQCSRLSKVKYVKLDW